MIIMYFFPEKASGIFLVVVIRVTDTNCPFNETFVEKIVNWEKSRDQKEGP